MSLHPEIIWFLLGLVLMILEFASPGVVFVFFGISAWLVGLLTYLGITVSLTSQLILFPAAAAAMLASLRKLIRQRFLEENSNDA